MGWLVCEMIVKKNFDLQKKKIWKQVKTVNI